MSTIVPGVPEAAEYNPAFAGYVRKAEPFPDPIGKLTGQLDEVLSLLRPLDATKQLHRYAPGKWSVREVLGHLTDAERIFSYRALRVGRNDQIPLPSFDENAYVRESEMDAYGWAEMLDEFEHVRKATILLFRHMPAAAWKRTGTASGAAISVRALAYITIGHVAHHLDILRERYL